jgi:iron(III) transport system permease protein
MNTRRRITAGMLAIFAAAIVFSPLVAALAGTGIHLGEMLPYPVLPLARSVMIAVMAAMVSLVLGFPFAILVDRSHSFLRRLCWGLGLLALIVPPYIVAESTIVLFGPAGKISRGIALLCGFGPPASDAVGRARFAVAGFVYSATAAGIVLGGCLFPIVALAVAAANRRMDRRVLESARLMRGRLGAIETAAHLLVPSALGGAMLVLAIALTEAVLPQLLRVQTISEAIYERIQEGNLSAAAGLSLPLLPLILLAGGGGAFLLIRARSASLAGLEGEVPKFTDAPASGLANHLAVVMTTVATLPGLIVPAVGLGWLMFSAKLPQATAGTHQLLRASGFLASLNGAWELARDDAVRTTLLAIFAATLAMGLAIALVRLVGRTRLGTILGGFGAGLAVPAPIVGMGLIVLWNHGATAIIYENATVVILAWMARFLPVAILLSQASLARVPVELEQAAALAGRGPFRRFMAVVLPAAAPGLAATWLAVYVLSATEFPATLLVAPPGAALLAPSVVNLMRRGQDPEIAACQVLLLVVVAVPLVVIAIAATIRSGRRIAL